GNLSVSGNNLGGGPFSITALGNGSVLTVNAGNITTAAANGAVNLSADDMTITGVVNAGAGIVTLQAVTNGRPIDLGTNSAGSTLGLTDAELDLVTTSAALRIGNTTNSGGITFTQAISQPAGYSTLSLRA